MSAAIRRTVRSTYDHNQEFEAIWAELYDVEDRNCLVSSAIHKAAWRRRPNYVSVVDFEKALLGRMYQKLQANFRNMRQAGVSATKWKKSVGKLTWTAYAAAGEEVNTLIEGQRSLGKPDVQQLEDGDSFAGRDSGSAVDRECLFEGGQASDAAGRELPPAHMSEDSGRPILQFLRGELRTCDALEHFRLCEDCRGALRLIHEQLLDFVASASSRPIGPRHVSAIRRLGLRTGAIQFLLQCRASDDADQATLSRLDSNLRLLGYKTLQPKGRGCSHGSSPNRMKQRDIFLRTLGYASTLLVFFSRPDLIIDRSPSSIRWPIIMISGEETLSNVLALGSMVLLMEHAKVLVKRETNIARTRLPLTKF